MRLRVPNHPNNKSKTHTRMRAHKFPLAPFRIILYMIKRSIRNEESQPYTILPEQTQIRYLSMALDTDAHHEHHYTFSATKIARPSITC